MISLEKYLNKKNFHYQLPLSFWEKIKFVFDTYFLSKLAFRDKIFISSKRNGSIYFDLLLGFLTKKLNLQIRQIVLDFRGRFVAFGFALISSENILLNGSGLDLEDKEVSISKAVGEFLERYSTYEMSPEDEKFVKTSNKTLFAKDVKTYCDYHREKFFLNISDSQEFSLLPVQEIVSGKKVFYPAQFIFWGKKRFLKNEPILTDTSTSGCAGAFSYRDGLVSAIYENIERDSFMCYWLTKSVPNKIEVDVTMPTYNRILRVLENTGFELYLFDITTNIGIPSCFCLVYNPKLGGLGVSGGSRVNMASAVECAIGEMFFMFNILNRTDYDMKKFENYIPFKTEGVLRNDRLAYWAMKKNFESIAFLFKGEKKKLSEYENKNISSKKEELEILLNKLRTLGQDYDQVYVYEAKNKILKTVGYHVVRAIMPKLYPLYLNEVMALTDSVRLEEFNLWKNGKKDFVINIEPHPFP